MRPRALVCQGRLSAVQGAPLAHELGRHKHRPILLTCGRGQVEHTMVGLDAVPPDDVSQPGPGYTALRPEGLMTMTTTYSGPVRLILVDGACISGMASLSTNQRGGLNGWGGTFRPDEGKLRSPSRGLRPVPHTPAGKRRRALALDQRCSRGRSAPSARLCSGPGTGPRRRERGAHASVQQRPHRRRQHQDQTDRPSNARTSGLHPAPPPHPPRVTARTLRHHRM